MVFITEEIDSYPPKFALDIKEYNFTFAFGVRDYTSREQFKFDPRYVKPVAVFYGNDGEAPLENVPLRIHPCNG